jgi:hypothetical protein
MTTSTGILAHPLADRNTLPAYLDQALTPRKARNRRLLCAALAAGLEIVTAQGTRYTVQSKSARYTVESWTDADGARCERCTCRWGATHGQVETYNRWTRQLSANEVLPCKHMLLVRFWRLDGLSRATLLVEDAAIRTAFLRGQRGCYSPAPAPAAAVALDEVAA